MFFKFKRASLVSLAVYCAIRMSVFYQHFAQDANEISSSWIRHVFV